MTNKEIAIILGTKLAREITAAVNADDAKWKLAYNICHYLYKDKLEPHRICMETYTLVREMEEPTIHIYDTVNALVNCWDHKAYQLAMELVEYIDG
jgi:hypothetical protein